MPKKPPISWRPSQQQLLKRSVANFNAKINRALKAHPELESYLPNKVTVKEMKAKIATSQDLRREAKSLSRLSQAKLLPVINEHGVKTTEYELQELKYKVRRINRIRAHELREMQPSTEKGTMGNIQALNLRPKKFKFDILNPTSWDKMVESIEKQASGAYQYNRAENYKENYLKAINDYLGADGAELYDLIKDMPAEHIFKNFGSDPVLNIGFTSDPLPSKQIATIAYDHWLSTLV